MFIFVISLSVLLIALIYFQSKYLILIDAPHGQSHKSLYNKNTPLSGGIYLFLALVVFLNLIEFNKNSILISTFLLSILVLGVFSDLKRNFSPKLRLLLQFITVMFFILFLSLKIDRTGIFFLDFFINNYLFNLIFTSLCITIIINGSNFCDGVNCNVIGYYLVATLSILLTKQALPENFPNLEILILIFTIFYIANIFQKSFLGDNGTYVISTFMSIYIINFINLNNNISPLLALNLLWYPAFENLFTIIRRLVANKKIQLADRTHLHILIQEKISNKKNSTFTNSLTGIVLNLFMFLGMYLSINFYNDEKILILILLINIFLYIIGYYYFYLRRKN
tara:strand:+ start:1883 stop:2896 length:1014 start_codon:yes stop_codon:yes gene_type:complete